MLHVCFTPALLHIAAHALLEVARIFFFGVKGPDELSEGCTTGELNSGTSLLTGTFVPVSTYFFMIKARA
jgi:hypothetical protein